MGQAALLMAEVEHAGEATAAQTERWQALTGGRTYLDPKQLQRRWLRVTAADGEEAASQADDKADNSTGDEAATLCLKMELVAGIDSPPEAAAERMMLQVERLNQGLGQGIDEGDGPDSGGRSGGPGEAQSLEAAWWRLARLPAARAMALTERFLRARDALHRKAGSPP